MYDILYLGGYSAWIVWPSREGWTRERVDIAVKVNTYQLSYPFWGELMCEWAGVGDRDRPIPSHNIKSSSQIY